jgi:hypothetical protein
MREGSSEIYEVRSGSWKGGGRERERWPGRRRGGGGRGRLRKGGDPREAERKAGKEKKS